MQKNNKIIRITALIGCAALIGMLVFARMGVYLSVKDRIYANVSQTPSCRAALVLGTQALPGGKLSPRLASRVDKAIELYKARKVEKLLMSGDGRASSNNEPGSMRDYAVDHGVRRADIVVDPAGFRTYDSVYRAKHVYGLDRIAIVTQGFHAGRSLFLAKAVGLDANAVPAEMRGDLKDQLREFSACVLGIGDAYFWKPNPVMGKKEKI